MKSPVFIFPLSWNKSKQQQKIQVQTQNLVIVLYGEVAVEVLDVSNANTAQQLSSERAKHHWNFTSVVQGKKRNTK